MGLVVFVVGVASVGEKSLEGNFLQSVIIRHLSSSTLSQNDSELVNPVPRCCCPFQKRRVSEDTDTGSFLAVT